MKSRIHDFFLVFLSCLFLFSFGSAVRAGESVLTKQNSQGTHYKIFVLSGQSNAVGVGGNTLFPEAYQAEQTNVQIWAGMQVDASLANKWLNVKPGFGAILAVSGSELSFAKEISRRLPNDNIRIIKGAVAGTSLVEYWLSPSAGVPSKEDLYHKLLNTVVKPALDDITAQGDTYEIAGFLWMQGESDASIPAMANAYEANLTHFIKDIRNDLGVSNLPFIIAKIDRTTSWPYNAVVRQAQDNVAIKMAKIGIFDTAGFETDGAHYLSPGYVKIGTQFADQWMITNSTSETIVPPAFFTSGLPSPAPTFVDNYNQVFDASFIPNAATTFPAFVTQWQAIGAVNGTEIQSSEGNTYFQFAWPEKRILISNLQYVAPYVFTAKIDYSAGGSHGGMIIRAPSNGNPDDLQETSAGDPGFNRAGIAFFPTDTGNEINLKFSGAITAPSPIQPTPENQTPAITFALPLPSGVNARVVGGATLRIEDYGTIILAYYNSLPLARIELSGFNGLVYTSGVVYDGSLNYLGRFTGKLIEYAGKVAISQRVAAMRLFSASTQIPAPNPDAFSVDKPSTSWSGTYDQSFNSSSDIATFYDQWIAQVPGIFTAADLTGEYLQFEWPNKRIIYSKENYSAPYSFEAEVDFSANVAGISSNRAGLVLRAFASNIIDVEYLQNPPADPGFNREGIAVYSNADGSMLNVQFSGIEAGSSTQVTTIAVPKPAGIASFLTKGTIRVEDFGARLYIYYNSLPVARIDLSGLSAGVYSTATVFNAGMQVMGVATGKEILESGKVSVCQRDAALRLYRVTIEKGLTTSNVEMILSSQVYQQGSALFVEPGVYGISIYNLQGHLLYFNPTLNGQAFSLENNFPKGVYLVKTLDAINGVRASKLMLY